MLTYTFQGYLTSQYGFQSNGFDMCDESKRKYKLISLHLINLQRGNYK